jgi:hypothetical protein
MGLGLEGPVDSHAARPRKKVKRKTIYGDIASGKKRRGSIPTAGNAPFLSDSKRGTESREHRSLVFQAKGVLKKERVASKLSFHPFDGKESIFSITLSLSATQEVKRKLIDTPCGFGFKQMYGLCGQVAGEDSMALVQKEPFPCDARKIRGE